jgi:hypothetical protein
MTILLALVGRLALAAMVSVLSSLATVHRILPNGIADEPIIIDDNVLHFVTRFRSVSQEQTHQLDSTVCILYIV